VPSLLPSSTTITSWRGKLRRRYGLIVASVSGRRCVSLNAGKTTLSDGGSASVVSTRTEVGVVLSGVTAPPVVCAW
jgi:hypothetical protein